MVRLMLMAALAALWLAASPLPAAADRHDLRQPPGDCAIKGNITRTGARVYHVPGGQYYRSIEIDTKRGERWFCSEEEARKAGWKKSRR